MRIGTPIRVGDEAMINNRRRSEAAIERLIQSIQRGTAENDQVTRHRARGKMLARERLEALADPGSPLLELSPLAGLDLYDGVPPGAGLLTAICQIHGRHCVVVANDATVKGGTYFPLTVKKHLRAQEIALENGLPCIYLVDSGGAFLPLQDQVFPDRDHFGRIFYNQARMSGLGIPQIAVVMGSCTAGGAYVPAMSDETIIVRNQGTIFLGGPPLVKAATGVDISAEDLGGGTVHATISGVADTLADDDRDALEKARAIIRNLGLPTSSQPLDHIPARPPLFPASDLYSLIPTDPKRYFPIREILARILDDSELDEFKPGYATSIICGFARLGGFLIGIVANDGILFGESARKAAHFIQLCDKRRIPLVFFQNITGFMVGKEYEHGGIARDGAKMVTAVSCCTVPKFTVILGGSFGAGNYGMAGRAYQPRTLFMWPDARISVMGPEQAAGVLTQVKADGFQAKGKNWPAEEAAAYRKEITEAYTAQASAYYATARLWDDGIIDPAATRETLIQSIAMSASRRWDDTAMGIFRM